MTTETKARPETGIASAAMPSRGRPVLPWPLVLLMLVAAAVGAAFLGARWTAEGFQTELALRPPVVLFDLAEAVREVPPEELGAAVARARERAERLAAGGFLVLDAQAVIAAPPELYLGTDGFPADAEAPPP